MIMKPVSIADPKKLDVILKQVHDCWFDVENIRFDSKTKLLTIKFLKENLDDARVLSDWWLIRKISIPAFECILQISHVNKYRIEDTEKVGEYDLNTINYDLTSKQFLIECGIPLKIFIDVDDFEVSFEPTKTVVNWRSTCSIF